MFSGHPLFLLRPKNLCLGQRSEKKLGRVGIEVGFFYILWTAKFAQNYAFSSILVQKYAFSSILKMFIQNLL